MSVPQQRLTVRPISLREANAYVAERHRHHGPARGCKFTIGVFDEDGLMRGIAIVGRPSARALDDGVTAEVVRTCTDGCPNANSALYGAASRAARAMGYRKILTYTQEGESGASLRGAGWMAAANLKPRRSWAQSSVKLRDTRDPIGSGGVARIRWEKKL